MGRASPWRGSRDIDKRQKRNDINRTHKNPQHKIALWKSIQHIYETPEILRSMFSTAFCLESDNGVSTSNRGTGSSSSSSSGSSNSSSSSSSNINNRSSRTNSGK